MIRDTEFNDTAIAKLIKADTVGRNQLLGSFIRALNTIESNAFLSIDANWGAGKTVFAKQLQYLSYCDTDVLTSREINTELISDFQNKYVAFYYNAWENDYHEDPLQSLLLSVIDKFYSADSRFENKVKSLATSVIHSVVKEGIKTLTKGIIDVDKINEVDTMDDLVKQISTVKERKEAVSKIIQAILPEGKKLLFIVDELDRCNPKFAVNLMEVMKHYYDDNNIVFVLSTNNRQLVHTVKKYYGNEFDGYGYLDKFYDVVFELPPIDINKYFTNYLGVPKDSYYINTTPLEISKHLGLSMREINRYYSSFDLIKKSLDSTGSFHESLESSLTNYIFIPFALALRIHDIHSYDQFMAGNGSALVKNLFEKNDTLEHMVRRDDEKKSASELAAEIYLKVISSDKLPWEHTNRDVKEAGERLQKILPLMSIVNKLDG